MKFLRDTSVQSASYKAKSVCAIRQLETIQHHVYTIPCKFTQKALKNQ